MPKLKKIGAAVALAVTLSNSFAATSYYLVAPIAKSATAATTSLAVSLGAATLPEAFVGTAYNYDLKQLLNVTGDSALDKSLAAWASTGLPAGLSITGGVITGSPTTQTAQAGQSVNVTATYKTQTGQQVYTIKVGDQYLTVKQMEVGERHACAVTPSGAVFCWGNNTEAQQLGDASGVDSSKPVQVAGLTSGVASVAVGSYHSCALFDNGAVSCWGGNGFGQLGNGFTSANSAPQPVVGLGGPVKQLSAGYYQTCAILSNNRAECWGYNGINARSTPADVGLTDVSSISAGAYHACASLSSGAAKCWGNNGQDRLGNSSSGNTLTPVTVTNLSSGVAKVSVGTVSSCALLTSGGVKCWGGGFLGNGVTQSSATPIDVPGIAGAVDLSVMSLSCVLTSSGEVKCWGEIWGVWSSATPQTITGFGESVKDVAVSNGSGCATMQSGRVQCWGANTSGKLGNGSTANSTTPVYVTR